MGRIKRFSLTLLSSGMATMLSFLISFLLTPFITNKLGSEAYGFVTLAKNFAYYATIVTLALNSYAARYIAVEYYQGNFREANKYVSSVFIGDVILAGTIFVIAILIDISLDRMLNISPVLIKSVKLLFLLVFINFVLTTVGTSFSASAYIKNRLDLVGIFRTVSYIVEIVTYILLFKYTDAQVWYVGVALLLAGIIVFFGNVYIFKKYTPELSLNKNNISFYAIRQLVVSGIWNSVNSIGNILNSGLDLLVANLMLSSLAMGQLAITKTISAIFESFNQMIAQPFQPLFLQSYSKGDMTSLLNEFKIAMKVSGLFSCLVFAGFYVLGRDFYRLWLPEQDTELIYTLTVLTFIYMAFEGPIYSLYYIYTLTVSNKIPCIITIIGGFLNVCGMYFLIKYTSLGVYAIVLTTVIVMTVISLITNPIYMTRCLKIKWYTFYPTFVRIISACVMMTFILKILSNRMDCSDWVGFGILTVLYATVGFIVYVIIVFSKKEKQQLASYMQKIILKK